MIVNRTLDYRKIREAATVKEFVDVSQIRKAIDELYKNIKILNIKQKKLSLPSFESKSKKRIEIKKLSDLIYTRYKEIENLVSTTKTNDISLNTFISQYFSTKLKTVFLEYKQVQQSLFNESIQETAIIDNKQKQEVLNYDIKSVQEIQRNIYEITNFILEMKMIMHLSSSNIDRLDLVYETTCENIESINNELKIMKSNYSGFKAKFLNFLFILVCLLLILSFIKIAVKTNKNSQN